MAKTGTAVSTVNTKVNYDDKRFKQVNTQKQNALNEVDKTYGDMIGKSDSYYQAQIDASKQWADKQTELQNQQTDFAIEKIEQEKAKAEKDYTKEQSGAYVDWQKQSNQYGVKAEQMASSGMTNTGYSESSQVAMYNTYQMRVATARESYNNAVLNYNNAIKDARLQNNSALADIAYKALQQQLELSLQGFQYKNQLILDKANKKTEVENNYYKRYQDVLAQINQEISLAEQIRQYNENLALQKAKAEEEKRQYNQTLALQKAQLEEEKRQYNETLALQKKNLNSSGGGSKGGSGGGNGSGNPQKVKPESNNSTDKVKANNSTSNAPKIDWNSVTALGYGVISVSRLDQLVASGQVIETTKNGVTTFKRAPATPSVWDKWDKKGIKDIVPTKTTTTTKKTSTTSKKKNTTTKKTSTSKIKQNWDILNKKLRSRF